MIKRFLLSSRKIKKIIAFLCKIISAEGFTYSQNCEDKIIESILNKNNGFYVDVGAHHPIRFSNTFQLYLGGWNGINIDPLPGCMMMFEKYRPNDVNLNVGISDIRGSLKYFSFKDAAYNTLSEERASYVINNHFSPLLESVNVDVVLLKDVFDKYLEKDTVIDVLTIDVETLELKVLLSNDWDKYRPRLIVMESIVSCFVDIEHLKNDAAISYLLKNNYIVVAKVNNAVFLRDSVDLNGSKT